MDVIIGAFLTGGYDPFQSGKKLGKGHRPIADLTPHEAEEYVTTFLAQSRIYPHIKMVLLHDGGLKPDIFAVIPENVTLEQIETSGIHANYERRFIAFRDWLNARPDISRVWMIDTGDVAFVCDPFTWMTEEMGSGLLAVGEEWTPYGESDWFKEGLSYLPTKFGQKLLGVHHRRHPLNCGSWGGTREAVLEVLENMVDHLDEMKTYLIEQKTNRPIMLDMHAFGFAVLDLFANRVVTFKMDGTTPVGETSSPLIHDRSKALEHIKKRSVEGSRLPDHLAAKIRHIQNYGGWCQIEKAEKMARLVLDTKPALIVEIGVFGGRSFLPQAFALKENRAGTIYGIDPWKNKPVIEGNQFGPTTANPHPDWTDDALAIRYEDFINAISAWDVGRHTAILRAPAERVADVFNDDSIDILHIDGNHSEIASVRDVNLYLPKVRSGGHIWFDDTDWESVGKAIRILEYSCTLQHDNGNYRLYRKN